MSAELRLDREFLKSRSAAVRLAGECADVGADASDRERDPSPVGTLDHQLQLAAGCLALHTHSSGSGIPVPNMVGVVNHFVLQRYSSLSGLRCLFRSDNLDPACRAVSARQARVEGE